MSQNIDSFRQMEEISIAQQVADIRANAISANSRRLYQNSMVHFLLWARQNTNLLTQYTLEALEQGEGNAVAVLRQILSDAPRNTPIHFDDLTAEIFLSWIVTLRKSNGALPGSTTYSGHRCALFNLFRD